ncbi:DUF397 domain-containing protein [Plantactinospora sp. WMMB782]|uniref:DUF397 domain-containing protein n=1 Tax=Plantactinospora sp. WMMB782 TaxID=3404121 RepID=UPI003B92E0B9
MDLIPTLGWRKSSHSESTSCVEVADDVPGRVLVRDSKDPEGPVLTFTPRQWGGFVDMAKRS